MTVSTRDRATDGQELTGAPGQMTQLSEPDRPVDLLQWRGHPEVGQCRLDQGEQVGLPGEGREFVVPDAAEELRRSLAQVRLGRGLLAAGHVLQHPVGIEQQVPDR
jgi:hypothetical protein